MTDKIRSYVSFFPDQEPITGSDVEEFEFRKWHIQDSYLTSRLSDVPQPRDIETMAFARQCLEDVRSVLHGEAG
jgi:hypothetical protein